METVNPKDSRKMNVVHFAHEIFDFVASVEFPAEILTARGLGFAKTLAPWKIYYVNFSTGKTISFSRIETPPRVSIDGVPIETPTGVWMVPIWLKMPIFNRYLIEMR